MARGVVFILLTVLSVLSLQQAGAGRQLAAGEALLPPSHAAHITSDTPASRMNLPQNTQASQSDVWITTMGRHHSLRASHRHLQALIFQPCLARY